MERVGLGDVHPSRVSTASDLPTPSPNIANTTVNTNVHPDDPTATAPSSIHTMPCQRGSLQPSARTDMHIHRKSIRHQGLTSCNQAARTKYEEAAPTQKLQHEHNTNTNPQKWLGSSATCSSKNHTTGPSPKRKRKTNATGFCEYHPKTLQRQVQRETYTLMIPQQRCHHQSAPSMLCHRGSMKPPARSSMQHPQKTHSALSFDEL
jgi:hypothetical protein